MYRITNGNDFDFIGRANGKDYLFPKGQPVYCDDEPAQHIFGIGQADKSAVIGRHGWAGTTASLLQGLSVLNAFAFEHMSPVYDAPLALIDDHGPAPVDQDSPVASDGTDGQPVAAGDVAVRAPSGNPSGRLPPA